ncbi:MAG: hypothetical protein ACK2U9_07255 [Anaerolineae bacterium]
MENIPGESLKEIVARQQAKAAAEAGERQPGWALLIELAEEVCVLRDRLDTAMRLSAAGLVVDEEAIDAFDIDEPLLAERLEAHRELFESLFARLDPGA